MQHLDTVRLGNSAVSMWESRVAGYLRYVRDPLWRSVSDHPEPRPEAGTNVPIY